MPQAAYLFLGPSQTLPFFGNLRGDILEGHVFEVSLASAFCEEDQVRRFGALDQSVIDNRAHALPSELREPFSCQIGLLNL